MRNLNMLAIAVVVFFSCRKSTDLSRALQPGLTDTTEIVGNWTLQASRIGFAIGNYDTSWRPATTHATIAFSSSGVFSSDGGYVYKNEQYDRYRWDSTGGGVFQLIATVVPSGNFPIYHATVRLVNKDALVVTYMGVDYTPEELYERK
ncbi:MAG TPA: hypothetical protein VHE54_04225 [Puia sp.]|nr:hypothetical protein [Puia sp.]